MKTVKQLLAPLADGSREIVVGSFLPILCVIFAAAPDVETQFVRVVPIAQQQIWWKAQNKTRAVVLIHGLQIHPFSKANVLRPRLHSWQKADSLLVKKLAEDSDVFAFSYGQSVSADEVAKCLDLQQHLRRLRRSGYRDIVLIGHSAGGIIARIIAEDHPNCGITKVIQVCAPNGGSGWAKWHAVRANQVDFLDSLSKSVRHRMQSERSEKRIPDNVEFVCIVGIGGVRGDGLVAIKSQYPPDLQSQGVPAYPLNNTHWMALRSQKGVELAVRLVRQPQPRWDAERIEAVRHRLHED